MEYSNIKIEPLAKHPHLIPQIAEWFLNEWGDHYEEPSIAYISRLLEQRMNTLTLPLTLVALNNEELAGTVNLKEKDLPERSDLTPWLGGLYVRTDLRNMGIGALLINAAMEQAKALGFRSLYLYTPSAKSYYEKLGWKWLEDRETEGVYVSVFQMSDLD